MTDTVMNRVPRDQLSPEQQASWDHATSVSGDATILEVFANSPKAFAFFSKDFYKKLFFEGNTPRRYKELMRYRLSLIHGCNFCNKNNRVSCLDAGITHAELDDVEAWNKADTPLTDADKAVLAYAEEIALTNMGGVLDQKLYDWLKRHFSDADIIEVGMVGAILSGLNKFAFVLDVVAKEDYCPFVPQQAAE